MPSCSGPLGSVRKLYLSELVACWGEKGTEPGQFKFGPHGCWIDGENSLYIGEVGGEYGVKLEDQVLVTERGAEPLCTYPYDATLLGL